MLKQGVVAYGLFNSVSTLDTLDRQLCLFSLQAGYCQGNFLVEWLVRKQFQTIEIDQQDGGVAATQVDSSLGPAGASAKIDSSH